MDPELMKILQKTKPNTDEEDRKAYISEVFDVFKIHIGKYSFFLFIQAFIKFPSILISVVKNETEYKELKEPIKAEFLHWYEETEKIDGYKNPIIELIFSSGSMDCLYKFSCEEQKLKELPYKRLSEFFEGGLLQSEEEFLTKLKDQNNFAPPGTSVGTFESKSGKKFEVNLKFNLDFCN
jgi:hypothetical protein